MSPMDCFEILADPTRRKMLARLAHRPHSVGELVAALPSLTQPAVSRHLRLLREAGFVDVRTDAQRRIYALREDCFAPLDDWLEACQGGPSGRDSKHDSRRQDLALE